MEWIIAGASIFFFTCLVAWAFSLYSKQAIAARTPCEPDYMRTRRRNLKGKPTQPRKGKLPPNYTPVQPVYPTPPKPEEKPPKGKLPSGYTPVQPIYPPASTPPEPPQSPPPPQPVVVAQPTPPAPPEPPQSPAPPQPVVDVQPTPPRPAKLTPWQLAGTNYRKILTFVDQKTAERLLQSASYKYPEKSEAWIVDKVLWDLQRDKFRG